MNGLFKVNSGADIGSGHFQRVLNLALALKVSDWNIYFTFSELRTDHQSILKNLNFKFLDLSKYNNGNLNAPKEFKEIEKFLKDEKMKQLNLILVDDYQSNLQWDEYARNYCQKLMIVEDAHKEKRNGDLILDMNFRPKDYIVRLNNIYRGKQVLVGPRFALLDSRYSMMHELALKKKEFVCQKIFINFGTLDNFSLTLRTVKIILAQFITMKMNVVIQSGNLDQVTLEKLAKQFPDRINLFKSPDFLGNIMGECDLSIGAGGISIWERFTIGLISIVVSTADNQKLPMQQLHESEFITFLGDASNAKDFDISTAIESLVSSTEKTSIIRNRLLELVDGLGVQRVLGQLVMDK